MGRTGAATAASEQAASLRLSPQATSGPSHPPGFDQGRVRTTPVLAQRVARAAASTTASVELVGRHLVFGRGEEQRWGTLSLLELSRVATESGEIDGVPEELEANVHEASRARAGRTNRVEPYGCYWAGDWHFVILGCWTWIERVEICETITTRIGSSTSHREAGLSACGNQAWCQAAGSSPEVHTHERRGQSEQAGKKPSHHSPDTLVLAMQAKKKHMLQSNQGS